MNTLKKILSPLLVVALLAIGAGQLLEHKHEVLPKASAQNVSTESYAGHNESTKCCSVAVGATTAVIFTAVSGKALIVKAIPSVTLSAAGILSFQDGSGGATLFQMYLAANTPSSPISEASLRGGFKTTAGNALYAVCNAAGTCTISAVVQQQ